VYAVKIVHAGLAILLMCSSSSLGWTEPEPDLVLRGVITHADNHSYRDVPFTVPADITRLTIDFSYTTRDQHTTIDLGLFDGERFRGWSGGNKATFTISETDATPSYLPGPLRPGTWKLVLGIPNIREKIRCEFRANVYFSRADSPVPLSPFSAAPSNVATGWYRGDLHMHTGHSDGSCKNQSGKHVPCPLFKSAEAAAARGLDFIAVTDHNTTSQYDAERELQLYFDRLLFLAGREITTFEGHANVFGPTRFIDFRLSGPQVPNVSALLKEVHGLHGLISINHPADPSGEACMGCGWTAPDTDFAHIDAIEAVNGGDTDTPLSGIHFWEERLNEGFRLTGIGGSDNHHADLENTPSSVGHPTTVIFAKQLSQSAILDGIRAGRVFIDVEGSRDRILDFSATLGQMHAYMGERLTAPLGSVIRFSIHAVHAGGAHVEVIEDGHTITSLPDPVLTQEDEVKTFEWNGDGSRHWFRVNVRSPEGHLLIVGNPTYLNF
jgi:hypothetical protein